MNVLMLSPGFPAEMPRFARGLAEAGVRVIGIGEHPVGSLTGEARRSLSRYEQVNSILDEEEILGAARRVARVERVDLVECLWEPLIVTAARVREMLGVEGMLPDQALLFRDKERMKQRLDQAGIRTPRHARASGPAESRRAAEVVGYPLIVKPIAGAGSADTYRVDSQAELEQVLPRVSHVPQLSVEEYIEGEEYTFDTICSGGAILYDNIAWYRPKPLIGRTVEWISPQTVTLREIDDPALAAGRRVGRAVLDALGFHSGFSHMEWFRTAEGEAVFGEIGARPPGARSVDLMNFACDLDTYNGWAEAVCHGRLGQPVRRLYNSVIVFKRAEGQGRIRGIEGLERLVARYRPHIVCIDLLPIGAQRRNWKQTLISDGYLILRHPHLATALQMADRVGTDLRLYAG